MGWFRRTMARLSGTPHESAAPVAPPAPAAPTSAEILAAVDRVQERLDASVPRAVTARVQRISDTVDEMVPRLDRLAVGSAQAHTVVATATSYLPEAVGAYLRLPRDFADTRPVDQGRTALMLLCDQLDLLGSTLDRISDAVSRQDADALVAHGRFLADTLGRSSITLPDVPADPTAPADPPAPAHQPAHRPTNQDPA
ncbi:hypothetical protein CLV28_0068 [Sediminihabitans luteus]|uniref:Phosphatase n=1 Tax=Sediminihabitans luteus TaxID=1138585 RepID=A0A2M9CY84_9CELL|nr:hypothetical protein [Sediminihabitans luteus]PJJ76860.1 hypothetical protein CLV28_0068 [Sediminihabitans luteus]GIJ00340.1 hypothetical protein Slu03_27170 [Sediminihabitans luteus]